MDSKNNENVLTSADLETIINEAIGDNKSWNLNRMELKKAADGLSGFLGDHMRMTIYVNVEEGEKQIPLFIKRIPTDHDTKADILKMMRVFEREAFMFNLFKKITTPDPIPWCPTTYLHNDKIVVMSDLAIEGYKTQPVDKIDDLTHALLAAVALARFHAAYANYATKRTLAQGKPYDILEEHGDILKETMFLVNPFTEAAALLHKNFLRQFSEKYKDINIDFIPLYDKAFKSVKSYENTLNVLVHRDLWINNIMFKYDNGVPTNAVLLDFQIVQYAPPAFDPMLFLYMSVTRSFRMQYEDKFLQYYFEAFMKHVDENTKKILDEYKYDYNAFREMCEKARMFAIVAAITICPLGFINSQYAAEVFDDPETYEEVVHGDRTKPIVTFAQRNVSYRNKLLDFFEEFVDRYAPNVDRN